MSSLTPVKKIDPPAWMRAPEIEQLMAILNAEGAGQGRFVGGCVRNHLLGLPVGDIDIATLFTPQQVTEKLEGAGLKCVPTGIDYGTVTAVINGRSFEITTLRKDVETDGRRAVVAFSKDWREDAERRDFTLNTLLADREGHIYDPTGQGLADLEKRRVIFVGDASQRIAEDYLRILRFFRFHAWYGMGEPDPEAVKACRDAALKIAALSAERVTQEWFKILSADNPVDVIELVFQNNILKEFSYSEYEAEMMQFICDFQKQHDIVSLSARLLVLAGLKAENIQKMQDILLLPKAMQKEIAEIVKLLALPDLATDRAVKVAVYKHGRLVAAQALLIEAAQGLVREDFIPEALKTIQTWEIPVLPVSGEDLKKAGIPEGPALGQRLKEIEQEWIAKDFKE